MVTPTSAQRFDGRTVVVTGAGSGIGRATAERLLAEGATVVAGDVNQERLDELAAAAATERLVVRAGDITDQAHIDELVALAGDELFGLVNNAGIMDGFVPTGEIPDDLWERVFAVNVTAPMKLIRAALPAMLESGDGRIVNVTSEAGTRAGASGTAYSASKHAAVGLTKSTAFFYGPRGIRCNAVAPGRVKTNIRDTAAPRSPWAWDRVQPVIAPVLEPAADPAELAAVICWLLSDDSSNINGVNLFSDAGWSTM
ncbi:SDR family NAD(P)-dependent oxidoreductase [Microbacterium sp. No. 7]|uniref:SDR family NAD(P)-dependent oxidoreductase n=1 Tax=Microbacterium sp. No. 7 TaxID=1714373 RepID=UPI0006D2AB3A|nr:SDR family NAD(P)-dependent oxidoreductase [Microbacterium sp. No. 7]ALJ18881.1 short-chain dehydrogenase [Microbacterium sp. No. 7]